MHGKKPRLCPKIKQNESWWEDQQTYVTYIFTEIDSLFNVVFVCNSCPKVCAKNLNSVKGTSQSKEMDVRNTFMQIQKQCALYKGWPGDAGTETLQRMARWCGYRNTEHWFVYGTKNGWVMWIQKHCTNFGQVMWIQKQWTPYKGWPGDSDTETMNTVQRMARWCGYRNTEHCTKDGQVMWIHKHVDTETLNTVQRRARWCGYRKTVQRMARWCEYRNTVQRMARWCGYRNIEHCTKEGQVMWIQKHGTLYRGGSCDVDTGTLYKGGPGDADTETLNTIQRRVMWCGYRNTVQRMTRWRGYRNTAHCTMNGQETKKAEKLHANWSRKRQDSLLGRASDHEDKHNTDRVFNSLVHRGIFLPQSALSADSLTVPVQPLCAIACINICAQMKNPKHPQPYHKNTAHTHRIWQHCSYAFCSHTQLR